MLFMEHGKSKEHMENINLKIINKEKDINRKWDNL